MKNKLKIVLIMGLVFLLAACSGGNKYKKTEYVGENGYFAQIEHDEKYAHKLSVLKPFKETKNYVLSDEEFDDFKKRVLSDVGLEENNNGSSDKINDKQKAVVEELSKIKDSLSNKKEDVKKLIELYITFGIEELKKQYGDFNGVEYSPSVDENWSGAMLNLDLDKVSDEVLNKFGLKFERVDGKVLLSSVEVFLSNAKYTKK